MPLALVPVLQGQRHDVDTVEAERLIVAQMKKYGEQHSKRNDSSSPKIWIFLTSDLSQAATWGCCSFVFPSPVGASKARGGAICFRSNRAVAPLPPAGD